MLLFHSPVSLAIATVAATVHVKISLSQMPSFVRVAPKYLKLDTSSSFSPSRMMLTLALFVLFTFALYFTACFCQLELGKLLYVCNCVCGCVCICVCVSACTQMMAGTNFILKIFNCRPYINTE